MGLLSQDFSLDVIFVVAHSGARQVDSLPASSAVEMVYFYSF